VELFPYPKRLSQHFPSDSIPGGNLGAKAAKVKLPQPQMLLQGFLVWS